MLPTKDFSNSVNLNEKEEPDGIPSQQTKLLKENTLPTFEFTEKTVPTVRLKSTTEHLKIYSSSNSGHSDTISSSNLTSSQNASQPLSPNFSTVSMETLSQEYASENRNQQKLPSLKHLYGILNTDATVPMHTVTFPEYHSTAHFSQDSKNVTVKQQFSHSFAIHGGNFIQATDGTGFKTPHNSFQSANPPLEKHQDGQYSHKLYGKRRLNSPKSSSSNSSTSLGGSSDNEFSDEVMQEEQDGSPTDGNIKRDFKSMDGDGSANHSTHHAKAKKRKKKKTKKKKKYQTDQQLQNQVQDGVTPTPNVVLPSLENMAPQHLYHSSSSSLDNSTGFSFRKQNQPSSAFLSPRNRTNNNTISSPHEALQQNHFDQYKNTSHEDSNSSGHHQQQQQQQPHSNFSAAALSQHNNYFAAHPNANFAPESATIEKPPNKPNSFKPRVIFGGNIVTSNTNSNSSNSNGSSATMDTRSSSSSGSKNEANIVINEGPWSEEEHARFLAGLNDMGRNWTKIAKDYVKSRVRTQVASHAQKYFKKVNKSATTPGDKEQDGQTESNHE